MAEAAAAAKAAKDAAVADGEQGGESEASDRAVAVPPKLPPGRFHTFISHAWGTGQDQARVCKELLGKLARGLQAFLEAETAGT